MTETIYVDEKKYITITVSSVYDQNFLDFAANTLWGTEGVIYKISRDTFEAEFKKFKRPN
jgi:hypothetical protein